MKLLYIITAVFAALFGVYFFMNGFSFDNLSFSNYLITTVFILLLAFVLVGGVAALLSVRKKKSYKNVMTIRQYYQYKSAR